MHATAEAAAPACADEGEGGVHDVRGSGLAGRGVSSRTRNCIGRSKRLCPAGLPGVC